MYLAHHEPESVNNIVDTVTANIRQALLQQAAHGHQGLPPYNIAMRLLVVSLTVNARSVWVLSIVQMLSQAFRSQLDRLCTRL